MAKTPIPDGMIRRILEDERSPIRFEDSCCDLFACVDGADCVGTSRSRDLGRDARTVPSKDTGTCGDICCATGGALDVKAESDLTRMLQFTAPARVYFCTSRLESEHALQGIEDRLRAMLPAQCPVAAPGALQLVSLIGRHPEPFERRYAAELAEHAHFLSQCSHSKAGADVLGMQVALATQFDHNAQALRGQLTRRLVLRSLSSQVVKTIGGIAKSVGDALRLPRAIHPEYFRDALVSLVRDGWVRESQGGFQITESGTKATAIDDETIAGGLERGCRVIRAAIEQLLGTKIEEPSFQQLWRQPLDEFAHLFFSQGLKIIQAIASLTRDEPHPATRQTFAELMEGMRGRITQLGVGGARCEAVAQSVIDLFSERDSEALAWLTDVAVKYVNLCSLGLEPTAHQEVSGRLKEVDLILDTDIVLSYLSEGKRPHKAIEDTITRWKEISGRVVILRPIVEEAAYHAWITDYEYREVWRQLANYGPEEMHHYVQNAFVRAFYFVGQGRFEPSSWRRFVGEYRGQNADDTSVMRDILEDRDFEVLDNILSDDDFAASAHEHIYAIRNIDTTQHFKEQIADKVRRDSHLLAHLKMERSNATLRYHTCVIISSSPVLQKAAQRLSDQLGEPSPVWPIGALAYVVSLVPGVRLTLGILRNCLFDERQFDMTDRVTQFAMRVIRQSTEYSVGYSQRPTLKKALQHQINKAAMERGQRPGEFVAESMDGDVAQRGALAEVIAEAVDTIEASKSEREIEKLKRTILEMTGE